MAGTNVFPVPAPLTGALNTVIQGLSKWLQGKLKLRPEYLGTPAGHLLFQSGQVNTAFNAGMDATLTFPQTFPTACMCVVATSASVSELVVSTNGLFPNAVNLRGNVASVTVPINYIAIGY